jgi:hypothetical protein
LPNVAIITRLAIGFCPASKNPTKTASDCIGKMLAAIKAEKNTAL